MNQDAVQACLALLSLTAVTLITGRRWQRWGHVFGLASQPFWLIATWSAGQWGMFVLALVYTFMWCRGIYNNFFVKDV